MHEARLDGAGENRVRIQNRVPVADRRGKRSGGD